jgi:hypothetical protein
MTPFRPFDKRLLEEGLAYFDRPRLASLLETLGTSKFERVDVLVTMLRHSSPEEFDEAVDIFERATARAARGGGPPARRAAHQPPEAPPRPDRRRAAPAAPPGVLTSHQPAIHTPPRRPRPPRSTCSRHPGRVPCPCPQVAGTLFRLMGAFETATSCAQAAFTAVFAGPPQQVALSKGAGSPALEVEVIWPRRADSGHGIDR